MAIKLILSLFDESKTTSKRVLAWMDRVDRSCDWARRHPHMSSSRATVSRRESNKNLPDGPPNRQAGRIVITSIDLPDPFNCSSLPLPWLLTNVLISGLFFDGLLQTLHQKLPDAMHLCQMAQAVLKKSSFEPDASLQQHSIEENEWLSSRAVWRKRKRQNAGLGGVHQTCQKGARKTRNRKPTRRPTTQGCWGCYQAVWAVYVHLCMMIFFFLPNN